MAPFFDRKFHIFVEISGKIAGYPALLDPVRAYPQFRFERKGEVPGFFNPGEVVIISSVTELALSQEPGSCSFSSVPWIV